MPYPPARRAPLRLFALLLLASLVPLAPTAARQPVYQDADGSWRTGNPEQEPEDAQSQRRRNGAKRNRSGKGGNGSSNAKKRDGGGADNEPSDSDEPSPNEEAITRPVEPPRVPDPRELEIEPVNGRVTFGFHGQPWPDVLQWLANASKMSLDWQELPPGYLNLTTQRAYSLPEARDLINRRLQARGYALLISGEVMSITRIDKLDPSLVPRITEDELYDRQPHDLVKLTFQLPPGIDVKEASEDVKQALSKHARLMPLAATKRLLVMDSVINLRLVSALLNEERIEREGREVPRRFTLRHARADQVIETLYVVLGVDPGAQRKPIDPKQLQRHMQMVQKLKQQGKKAPKLPGAETPQVHLAYNRHDNSILANAPPEQLAIIERTIGMLDIPPPGVAERSGAGPAARFAKTYELESIEPDSLITSLEEIGNLDPLTDLRGDRKSKVLFARASAADHQRIETIIEQLDGPKHRVEMYTLRRHDADEVAGTLMALVGGKGDDDDEKARRRRYYGYGYYDRQDEQDKVKLRVEADIENNRIFVRGDDPQMEEVEAFLVQIGELPGPGGRRHAEQPVRVLEAIDNAATDRLLEQLRASWPALGGGAELRINDGRLEPAASTEQAEPPRERPDSAESQEDGRQQEGGGPGRTTRVPRRGRFRFASEAAASPPPPPGATVTVTEDGRLVLSSDDPELLRRLEDLVGTLRPTGQAFHEFRLEHVAAWYVHTKLEDFYDEILNAGKEASFNRWGEYQGDRRADQAKRLSRRRRLRMVYNSVTNSIVVTNAAPAQLQEIERLIELWDQPPKEQAILQRRTGMVKVRYSRASTIANALKDVYRDLLSKRDKEFDTEEAKGGGFAVEKLTQIEYSGAEATAPGGITPTRKTKAIETTFDGSLSIGVDELANMLVISADAELYAGVVDMIQQLDEQAKPGTTVEVLRVGVPVGPLRSALGEALGRPWPGGQPENRAAGGRNQRGNQQQQQKKPQQRRRGGSRGRSR